MAVAEHMEVGHNFAIHMLHLLVCLQMIDCSDVIACAISTQISDYVIRYQPFKKLRGRLGIYQMNTCMLLHDLDFRDRDIIRQ
jgi:hypothetical protein